MNRRHFLAAAAAATLTSPPPALVPAGRAQAVAGNSLSLDGAEYRLLDVLSPDPSTPLGKWSADVLSALLAAADLTLSAAGPPDRWDRTPARAVNGAASLAEALIARGAGRVRPESDDHAGIRLLLAAEDDARRQRRGLWAEPAFSVLPAERAGRGIGTYSIVAGEVVSVAARRARTFVNFGSDYRTDFTAGATSRLTKKWRKSGPVLEALTGRTVRIRGYLAWINGPSVDLTHPLQIETIA
jgi:endonuclease YncB( thermonuclease family)